MRVRPTVARVDLGVLKANYRAIADHLARQQPSRPPGVIGVVKANAYGHGAAQVGRALEDGGADLLACADIEEGAVLRAAGVRAEILVFGALSVSDLDGLFDGRLTPTISTPGAARAVQAAAARYKQRVRFHLKIDTGMNRLGFRFDNLRRTLPPPTPVPPEKTLPPPKPEPEEKPPPDPPPSKPVEEPAGPVLLRGSAKVPAVQMLRPVPLPPEE